MDAQPLTFDVFSDVVCPWCYLGKRRLAAALALVPGRRAEVRWRPFRLDPTIPAGGIPREDYLTRKFGSVAAIEPSHRRLTELGAAEGIVYRFDGITRSPNTVDAHRLIRWAAAEERQDEMVERLFAAYFTEGRDIGDPAVLSVLAREAGFASDIATRLASDADRRTVEDEIDAAYRMGVTGVPCFIVNRRIGVIGAERPEVLVEAIRQAEGAAPAGASVA
jgi:predicted DsbA family dithiol-disulfide isomerase